MAGAADPRTPAVAEEATASLVSDNFTLRVDLQDSSALRVIWLGRVDARTPALSLRPFFEALARRAKREERLLIFSLESLSHFNSSTIAELVRFVHRLPALGCHLELRFNPSKRWQMMTCVVFRRFESAIAELSLREVS